MTSKEDADGYEFYLLPDHLDEIEERIAQASITMPSITGTIFRKDEEITLELKREQLSLIIHYYGNKTPFSAMAQGAYYDKLLWRTAMFILDADAYEVSFDYKRITWADEKETE